MVVGFGHLRWATPTGKLKGSGEPYFTGSLCQIKRSRCLRRRFRRKTRTRSKMAARTPATTAGAIYELALGAFRLPEVGAAAGMGELDGEAGGLGVNSAEGDGAALGGALATVGVGCGVSVGDGLGVGVAVGVALGAGVAAGAGLGFGVGAGGRGVGTGAGVTGGGGSGVGVAAAASYGSIEQQTVVPVMGPLGKFVVPVTLSW
jgi:hypothetical protein